LKQIFEDPLHLAICNSKSCIAEIAGKDSIAAVLKAIKEKQIEWLVGIGLYHRAIYGNINQPADNFEKLINMPLFKEITNHSFIYLDISDLFEQLIIRNTAVVQKHFHYFNPCPACHLLFHMIRIPLARFYNIDFIITGEREFHDNIQKLNQLPEILSLFKFLIEKTNIELVQPIRKIKNDSEVYKILGNVWQSNITPSKCIFSKSYYDEQSKIPFDLNLVISSLNEFYFPLFTSVIDYIDSHLNEPSKDWIRNQVLQVINNIKK
jgi:hypothetical protein